jgi:uncharacterized protein with NRDE domain
MCLALLDIRALPQGRVTLLSNRDEFHRRPAAPLAFWADAPAICAGRDLEARGTWLGVTREGRFGFVTNFRDPARPEKAPRSRGAIVPEFLLSGESPLAYAEALARRGAEFAGFNAILGDARGVAYLSNAGALPRALAPGLYGVSNGLLETDPARDWPKLQRARRRYLAGDAPFDVLADRVIAPDAELPRTGVPLEWERRLSAIFIAGSEYGTRASTVLEITGREIAITERAFGPGGAAGPERSERFAREPAR